MAELRQEPTGWVGWVFFASLLMLLAGGLQLVSGLVALFNNDFYLVTERALVAFDYTTWGWIHIGLGITLISAGLSAMVGGYWGRAIGSIIAILSVIANMAFLSTYPLWSITIIVVDLLVLYGLVVHGGELRE